MPQQSSLTSGEQIACSISPSFAQWISQANGSVALTTYQAGKVVLISWDAKSKQVTLLPRQFDKPMGLAQSHDSKKLALATRNSVILLADAPLLAHDYLEDQKGKYGALYLPRAQYDQRLHRSGRQFQQVTGHARPATAPQAAASVEFLAASETIDAKPRHFKKVRRQMHHRCTPQLLRAHSC